MIQLPTISAKEIDHLEQPMTIDKVTGWSCESSKSPGYDGLNIKFIKVIWTVIWVGVISFIQEFFITGRLHNKVNTTWITLVSKKRNAVEIGDYKPII